MTISELSAGQGNVNVEGLIIEAGEPKSFSKFGKTLTVIDCILKDDSGNIKLTLWNDDSVKYKQGDKVKIINGYVNEFKGEKQLTAGKFGKIEKVGESAEHKLVDPSELSVDDPSLEDAGESTGEGEKKEIEEEFF